MIKICIIGGGAAGISASISASKGNGGVVLFERTGSVLNKFVLSGGGRCNISNENLGPKYYFGGSGHFVANVLKSFGKNEMLSFLKEIGSKYTVEKDGRIYTGDAKDTAHKLISYSASLGTEFRYKAFIEKVGIKEGGFVVSYRDREEFFDRVIIATGGKSYPETGSDGFGFTIAESLGHTVIHPLPGLIALDLKPNPFSGLQGISIDAEIILENKKLGISHAQKGKLLFTHRGISGPAAHNISGRYIRISREKGTSVFISFLPDLSGDELNRIIQNGINTAGKKKLLNLLTKYLPDRLVSRILLITKIPEERILAELRRDERTRLISNLTRFGINISGSAGFRTAHITTGGVSLSEVHSSTMESKIVKGLFFAGEILDADGVEGGYNLHWAFATGFIAGKNALKKK